MDENDIQAEFIQALLNDVPLDAAVSGRVTPSGEEGEDYPYITTFLLSGADAAVMEGSTGLRSALFQVSCWGLTQREANLTGKHVERIVKDARGVTWGPYDVDGFIVNFYNLSETSPYADDQQIYQRIIDVRLHYHEVY